MKPREDRLLDIISAELFGRQIDTSLFEGMDAAQWKEVLELSCPHNVQAIALDGILHHIPAELQPPKMILVSWFAMADTIEKRYAVRCGVITKMARLFAENGMEMMLLKGAGLASYYPFPFHRRFSDVDFHVEDYKRADGLLQQLAGFKVSNDHHHHTICAIDGVLIENHYDFINTHAHRSSAFLEKHLKKLVREGKRGELFFTGEGQCTPDVPGAGRVVLPPATFNALFLMRHMSAHWAAAELGLKNLCDWGVFLRHQGGEVDSVLLDSLIHEYGMSGFADSVNIILVERMGMDSSLIPGYSRMQVTPEKRALAERVLQELISPAFPFYNESRSKNPVSSVAFRTRRFFANKWKHEICYCDSFWGTFFQSSFSHILKPKSLIK